MAVAGTGLEASAALPATTDKLKKSKKSKKVKDAGEEAAAAARDAGAAAAEAAEAPRKKRKRDASSAEAEQLTTKKKSKEEKKAKKAKAAVKAQAEAQAGKAAEAHDAAPAKQVAGTTSSAESAETDVGASPCPASVDPSAVATLDVQPAIKQVLLDRGITNLFEIQTACLPLALQGDDIVGRARTGCGKTLAFVLPIAELTAREGLRPAPASPCAICLLPTRELAQQVFEEFGKVGKAVGMRAVCVYGGSSYGPQSKALSQGVHVVVGTPGRVKDHIERGNLKMRKLRFRVLDECDEMLNMGFAEDVEKILGAAQDSAEVQTMLLSATLPPWVKQLQEKYLQVGRRHFVDLVKDEKMKASTSVEHKVLHCHWSQNTAIIQDLVRCYGLSGRTIVFTDTKSDANEIAAALAETVGARALHGDIAQAQREVTLKGFRDGKFSVLVATDVAARGLDITGVDLVLQEQPPKEFETYIHRSGRTGRASSKGVCITLCSRSKEDRVRQIEKKAGFSFQRIGPPQPKDMAAVAAQRVLDQIQQVDGAGSTLHLFKGAAKELLAASESAEVAVAKALAHMTGYSSAKSRSLISAEEGFQTFVFSSGTQLQRPGFVFGFLRRHLEDNTVDQVRNMRLTKDLRGAVFDVPVSLVDEFTARCCSSTESTAQSGGNVTVADSLPELKPRDTEGQEGNSSYGNKNFNRQSWGRTGGRPGMQRQSAPGRAQSGRGWGSRSRSWQ